MTLPTQLHFIKDEMHNCGAPGEFQCTICLGNNGDGVVRIDHNSQSCYFHRECLISWFSSADQQRGTCPNDRAALFEPDPLTTGQLDAPFAFGLSQVVRYILDVMQEGNTPSQMAFDYRDARAVALRATAHELLSQAEPGPESDILQRTLDAWALSFIHTGRDEIERDLHALRLHVDFLKSRASVLTRSELRQLMEYRSEIRAIRHAFRSGPGGDLYPDSAVAAEQVLALFNRSQALLVQVAELRSDHNGPLPAPIGPRLPEADLDEDQLRQIRLALAGLAE